MYVEVSLYRLHVCVVVYVSVCYGSAGIITMDWASSQRLAISNGN